MDSIFNFNNLDSELLKYFNLEEINSKFPLEMPLNLLLDCDNSNEIEIWKLKLDYIFNQKNITSDKKLTIVLIVPIANYKQITSYLNLLVKIYNLGFDFECIIYAHQTAFYSYKFKVKCIKGQDFKLEKILEKVETDYLLFCTINGQPNETVFSFISENFFILKKLCLSMFSFSGLKYLFFNRKNKINEIENIGKIIENFLFYQELTLKFPFKITYNKKLFEILKHDELLFIENFIRDLNKKKLLIVHDNLQVDDRLLNLNDFDNNFQIIEIDKNSLNYQITKGVLKIGLKYLELISDFLKQSKIIILFSQASVIEFIENNFSNSGQVIYDYRENLIDNDKLEDCIKIANSIIYRKIEDKIKLDRIDYDKKKWFFNNDSNDNYFNLYEILNFSNKNINNYYDFSKNILEKTNKRIFVLLPSIPWNTKLFQRHQHIALTMAKLDFLVIYLSLYSKIDEIENKEFKLIESNVWITDDYNNIINLKNSFYTFFSPVSKLGTNNNPYYLKYDYLKIKENNSYLIYDYIDTNDIKINGSEGNNMVIEINYNDAIINGFSDLIVTTADSLYDEIIKVNKNVIKIKNGVNYEDYQLINQKFKLPSNYISFCQRYKIIVGYFGAIAPWLDYNLLNEIVNDNEEIGFIMIGPLYYTNSSVLPKHKNFLRLDYVPYCDLPNYANLFSICLLPFEDGEIAKTTSPLKLYEYFALGKPIISTSFMKECLLYPEVFKFSNKEEFRESLGKALKKIDDNDFKLTLKNLAKENDWFSRCVKYKEEILKLSEKSVISLENIPINNNFEVSNITTENPINTDLLTKNFDEKSLETIEQSKNEIEKPIETIEQSKNEILKDTKELLEKNKEKPINKIENSTKKVEKTIINTRITNNKPIISDNLTGNKTDKPIINFTTEKPKIETKIPYKIEKIKETYELPKNSIEIIGRKNENNEMSKNGTNIFEQIVLKLIDRKTDSEIIENNVSKSFPKILMNYKICQFILPPSSYKKGKLKDIDVLTIRFPKNFISKFKLKDNNTKIRITGCTFQECILYLVYNNTIIFQASINQSMQTFEFDYDYECGNWIGFSLNANTLFYLKEFIIE